MKTPCLLGAVVETIGDTISLFNLDHNKMIAWCLDLLFFLIMIPGNNEPTSSAPFVKPDVSKLLYLHINKQISSVVAV